MFKPEKNELVIANEWVTLIDRPSLTKDQLREYSHLIYHSDRVDQFIDSMSAIHARILYDLENDVPSYASSDMNDFLGKKTITVLTDEQWKLQEEKILKEKKETEIFEKEQIDLKRRIQRQKLIDILEKEIKTK